MGLPQECFLTTASVAGTTGRRREGERRKRQLSTHRNGSACTNTETSTCWMGASFVFYLQRHRCTVVLSPTLAQALGPACREFRQRIDRAVSYVSEHAGAGGDTGLCLCCISTFVYTCNQMDSSRSNEREGGIASLRSPD